MKPHKMPQIWWNGLIITFLLQISATLNRGNVFGIVFGVLAIVMGGLVVGAFFILRAVDDGASD
jgi:hypothetical protein